MRARQVEWFWFRNGTSVGRPIVGPVGQDVMDAILFHIKTVVLVPVD